jgi:hypothetical protein
MSLVATIATPLNCYCHHSLQSPPHPLISIIIFFVGIDAPLLSMVFPVMSIEKTTFATPKAFVADNYPVPVHGQLRGDGICQEKHIPLWHRPQSVRLMWWENFLITHSRLLQCLYLIIPAILALHLSMSGLIWSQAARVHTEKIKQDNIIHYFCYAVLQRENNHLSPSIIYILHGDCGGQDA